MIAADFGYLYEARRLIELGADVNLSEVSASSFTPLLSAAKNGHAELVRLFILSGASLRAQTRVGGASALHLAAYNQHAPVMELLFYAGVDDTLRNDRGQTARSSLYGIQLPAYNQAESRPRPFQTLDSMLRDGGTLLSLLPRDIVLHVLRPMVMMPNPPAIVVASVERAAKPSFGPGLLVD